MNYLEEIDQLFNRLKELDKGNKQRTAEEQKEVRTILDRLRTLYVLVPEAFDE